METTTIIIEQVSDHDGDEVIIAFAQAVRQNGIATIRLQEWIARYPAHARELCCHAASCWACNDSDEFHAAQPHEVTSTNRVREVGLAALRAARPAPAPMQNLLQAALKRGMDAEQLADRLKVPFGFVFKLHRRLISPDSVPAAFVRQVAETLGHTQAEVAAYLRQPPTLAAGASYRADDTPEVGERETFAEALTGDPDTTQAQAAYWLRLP